MKTGTPRGARSFVIDQARWSLEIVTRTDRDSLLIADQAGINVSIHPLDPDPGALAEVVLVTQRPVIDFILDDNPRNIVDNDGDPVILGADEAIRSPDDVGAEGVLTSQIDVLRLTEVQGIDVAIFVGKSDGNRT